MKISELLKDIINESRIDFSIKLLDSFSEIKDLTKIEIKFFDKGASGIFKFIEPNINKTVGYYEIIITPGNVLGQDIDLNISYDFKPPKTTTFTSYTGEILSKISKIPGFKVLSWYTFAQGQVGLYKHSDGNVYQIIVRPSSMIGRDYPTGQFRDLFGSVVQKKGQYVDGVRLKDIDISDLTKTE
jgi:hypothetical protein